MPFSEGGFIPITFSYDGAYGPAQIVRKFSIVANRVESLEPAWEQVGEDLLGDFRQNFAQEGGFFGKDSWAKWKPLRPSTIEDRLRKGYGGEHPILQRTGTLYEGVTERGAPGNVFEVGPNYLVIGTTVPYAIYHNSSAPRKSNLPRRPIIGLSNERKGWAGHESTIITRLREYVNAQIQAAGLGA